MILGMKKNYRFLQSRRWYQVKCGEFLFLDEIILQCYWLHRRMFKLKNIFKQDNASSYVASLTFVYVTRNGFQKSPN